MLAVTIAAATGGASAARAQTPGPVDPRLFVIGDSVMLGAHDALVARLPGWSLTLVARESQSTLAAPSLITANRAAIGEVVIVALGNNDAGNPATFGHRVDAVMQALPGVRRVIWVNLRNFASWVPAANVQLAQATARWPTLEIADWDGRATPDPSLVYPDGLHLRPSGQAAMAELVAEHLGAYVQARIAAATSTTTTTRSRLLPGPGLASGPSGRPGRSSDVSIGLTVLASATFALALGIFLVGRFRSRPQSRASTSR